MAQRPYKQQREGDWDSFLVLGLFWYWGIGLAFLFVTGGRGCGG